MFMLFYPEQNMIFHGDLLVLTEKFHNLPSLAVPGLGVESESKMSMGRALANNNEVQKCSPLMEQVEYTFKTVCSNKTQLKW